MNHATMTRVLHTRWTLLVAAILAATSVVVPYLLSEPTATVPSVGLVAGWGAPFALPSEVGLALAAVLNAGIVVLMLHLSKAYNLLRGMSRLNGSMFLFAQLATPWLLFTVSPGLIVCLVVLWCTALLYMDFGLAVCDTRKVFLAFVLLSACTSFNYAFIFYIPILFLACMQLRIFSFRCFLAIVMGLATPWIIFFGFGLVTTEQVQFPLTEFTLPTFDTDTEALLAGTVIFTCVVTLGSWAQNVVKIITYNAQLRAMLSVITTLTLITVIAALLDISHIAYYLTLLNSLMAFQLAHLFVVIHNYAKSYFIIIAFMIVYLVIYACNILTLIY